MEFATIFLRILHIFSGVFWAGAVWMMALFIEPTSRGLGPDGGKFMNYLATVRRYPLYVSVAAVITLLAGWGLFFMKYGMAGLSTNAGLTFAIGGIVGLVAGAIGGGVVGRAAGAMTRLSTEFAQQGKPPSPEQMTQLRALQDRLRTANLWTAVLVSFALLTMAVAREL